MECQNRLCVQTLMPTPNNSQMIVYASPRDALCNHIEMQCPECGHIAMEFDLDVPNHLALSRKAKQLNVCTGVVRRHYQSWLRMQTFVKQAAAEVAKLESGDDFVNASKRR